MRKFQRVAVVAAAVAGISFLGAGVSSAAGGEDAPPQITAVANSTANAVATGGDYLYNMPAPQPEMQPEEQQAQPQEQQAQPEAQPQVQGNAGPEQGGYEQNQGDQ
ncbi:hypothetical protein [Streptomyces sp. L2]|uniref:hypothetical protein n=1 Tax=Streptomyces sp. L2 TaxID=2162665 RepID=UPI0010129118|nr:hypothetical protein [Streptomyces sp. L2]